MRKVLDLAVQMADALAAAHACGVTHRDLKPDNIMVTPEERVKVLDFGLAKRHGGIMPAGQSADDVLTQTGLTGAGVILGTVGYMAPEQAAGRAVGHTADQFSFGAILYEMLSGRRAFDRETAVETLSAIIRESPAPLQTLNSAVPASLQQIVERCLAKNPADRYPATGDLAVQLRDVEVAAAPVSIPRASRLDPAARDVAGRRGGRQRRIGCQRLEAVAA